ncbi:hypothetical protein OKW41_007516 [Paraburkholderia sp. UCT70]|uniref:hybrid sensor histidine kinase/response regulator n=1 Tax=Paraburkholderia sp. UCT70 TaxID=2991068 RepID=UPI003D2003EB
MVVIEIVDNGIGIDSSVQPHVFELFAQSACGSAWAEGGLGIGLAVAKRMVELHDGTISIHSEGTNRGTAVTLRLPILRSRTERLPTKDSAESLCLEPVRLLLVDDNPDVLQSLGILLKLEGHQITMCDNGRDAVRFVKEANPEVQGQIQMVLRSPA